MAGGPVVIVEESQPEVVAESPRSGWIVPAIIGLIVVCAIACGNDDEPVPGDGEVKSRRVTGLRTRGRCCSCVCERVS